MAGRHLIVYGASVIGPPPFWGSKFCPSFMLRSTFMQNFQPKRILGLLLVAVLLFCAASAGGSVRAQAALSKLRFVHAAVGAPNVDIYVANELAASNLAFGDATRFL